MIVVMSITASGADRVVRQSKMYAPIVNNKLMYTVIDARLIDSATSKNVYSRAGMFDDANDVNVEGAAAVGNGVFVMYNSDAAAGAKLAIVTRSSQGDTVVPQSQWNIDTLDGQGPSSVTLDPTAEKTFVFEWTAFKSSIVRVGVMHEGKPLFCHKLSDVSMNYASVPLRWELGHLDAAAQDSDAATMIQGSGCIMVQDHNEPTTMIRSKASALVKSVTSPVLPLPIWSLRLRPADNRARVLLKRLRIMNIDAGLARWALVLNPTLTGAAFTDVENSSYAQFSDAETAITGGLVLATGFVSSQDAQTVELGDKSIQLLSDIVGTPDVLTLQVQYLRGVVSVSSSVDWSELDY